MHCHFNCCGSGCDFGIVRCLRTRLKKDTVSRSLTKLNVTNIKRCDHMCVCDHFASITLKATIVCIYAACTEY